MVSDMIHNIGMVARGEATVTELAQKRLELLKKENPAVNAVVEYHPEKLLSEAAALDRRLAEGERLQMAGSIITVKDNLNVEGMKSTAGMPSLKGNTAASDCDAVLRLREAGALILGKTNMPPGAMDAQTDNPVYGRTNHPLFNDRTCGGSCGGGAAAVALGISDMDIGNDLMGSIRIPAHFCGLYGFVPTGNTIFLDGFSGGTALGSTMAQMLRIGIQSKSPENIRHVLPLLRSSGCPTAAEETGDKLKIAWSADCGGLPVSRDVADCMARFRQKLSASHELYTLSPDDYDFDAARDAFIKLLYGAMAAVLPPAVVFAAKNLMHNKYMNNRLKDYLLAEDTRERCKRQLESLFSRYDCLIVPVTATPAFPHLKPDRVQGNQAIYSKFEVDGVQVKYATANLGFTTPFMTANPVMTLPIGTNDKGLPIGVQVVCGQYCEDKLFEIVEKLKVL